MRKIARLVDANLNRLKEGLRVCEDISRFILNEKRLTSSFKTLRHKITTLAIKLDKKIYLLKARNIKKDVGKKTSFRESRRKNIKHIFLANLARAKESLRVLEEISKLFSPGISENFKKVRFKIYDIEKTSRRKLETLLHN